MSLDQSGIPQDLVTTVLFAGDDKSTHIFNRHTFNKTGPYSIVPAITAIENRSDKCSVYYETIEDIMALLQWCDVSWCLDNTAGIVTRRSGFQRRLQDVYHLPVVVEDSGYPAQSSTTTLNIRVCSCGTGGSLLTCSAEAISLPVGLSTGALMAILLCVALLIGKCVILTSCILYFFPYHTVVTNNTNINFLTNKILKQ